MTGWIIALLLGAVACAFGLGRRSADRDLRAFNNDKVQMVIRRDGRWRRV
ncbi:MAG: hypothetical protein PVSMB1_04170 [Gemmatimonadaceae bacterium]